LSLFFVERKLAWLQMVENPIHFSAY
jgi:hypothetical protein